jgi:hypothetical protein
VQQIKVRQALQGRATVVIDQRDQDKLDLAGDEQLVVSAHEVPVSQQVTLRTVDNFQGCEGDVIILSTVRNVGGADGPQSKGTIGFLKVSRLAARQNGETLADPFKQPVGQPSQCRALPRARGPLHPRLGQPSLSPLALLARGNRAATRAWPGRPSITYPVLDSQG